MKKFAEKFVAQEIDMEIVPFLTEGHLEQLGVNTIGARLRILQGIKALKGNTILLLFKFIFVQ